MATPRAQAQHWFTGLVFKHSDGLSWAVTFQMESSYEHFYRKSLLIVTGSAGCGLGLSPLTSAAAGRVWAGPAENTPGDSCF